jgi:hypothetical protein
VDTTGGVPACCGCRWTRRLAVREGSAVLTAPVHSLHGIDKKARLGKEAQDQAAGWNSVGNLKLGLVAYIGL